MLLGTLGASLLENMLTGKGVKAKIHGKGVIRVGEGMILAGKDFKYHLIFGAKFEILKYYQTKRKFNGVY